MQIVSCPDLACLTPAEVLDRWEFASTDGPVEHVKIRCLNGHSFLLPAAAVSDLAARTRPATSATSTGTRRG